MVKSYRKCKRTNLRTSDGLENVNGLTSDVDYTITNICQTGNYEVEINTSSMILHRKFPINCGE